MIGDRIRQVRELLGFTQTEVAQTVGIAQSAIAQVEAGVYAPSEGVLEAIAFMTGFDMEFFKQLSPAADFPIGSFLYRTQAKVSSKDKARTHRLSQLMFEAVVYMRTKLRPINVLLPRTTEGPEVAARLTRTGMGLSPDSPIGNLTNSIEKLGVVVLKLPLVVEGLDGFSTWAGRNSEIPVICVLGSKIGYRPRFTLGEELGHLAMHSPLVGDVKQADNEARRFAGELLLPSEAIRKDVLQPVTLTSLTPLRRRWRVSYQFLVRRLYDLQIVTPNQYKYLLMQISSRGWKKVEPGDLDVIQEEPLAFEQMVKVVYGAPPNLASMRRDLGGIPISLLKALVSGDQITETGRVLQFKEIRET
jgi:Zn-dependent peptidase ImmA (M78 family)/transcriptional regulator with XRE-family HTH domain